MGIGIFTHFALETTLAERQFFCALAKLIGRTAARSSACGIAAVKYPGFADRVHDGLVDIFGETGRNIVTHHAENGSGVGSAIIAAMTKIRKDAGLRGRAEQARQKLKKSSEGRTDGGRTKQETDSEIE
ncbi:hypothetical protein K438DRAFT_1764063 [Mycena galopus ATCC 62051]|nr:hypothetical protein K438DRAFT_1764063 [Mycena galopus ATCC 62051]